MPNRAKRFPDLAMLTRQRVGTVIVGKQCVPRVSGQHVSVCGGDMKLVNLSSNVSSICSW